MEIIQESDIVEEVIHELSFWYKGHHGQWGFGFECEPSGTVDRTKLRPEAARNLDKCLSGEIPQLEAAEIVSRVSVRRIPRIGQCRCGEKIHLANFTNTCTCGADYNSAGTLLAPREQWGEETGEHPSECY